MFQSGFFFVMDYNILFKYFRKMLYLVWVKHLKYYNVYRCKKFR